jgi:DNA-binding HxlR family transcriptional regulator
MLQESQRSYEQLCPVAVALDLLGDRWTLLLLRDLLWHGPMRFRELEQRNPGLSTSLLSGRLRELARAGLVERIGPERAGHYRPTESGEAVRGIVDALYEFGLPLLRVAPLSPEMLAYTVADIAHRRRAELLRLDRSAAVRLDVDGVQATVVARPGMLEVRDEAAVDASLCCTQGTLIELLLGREAFDEALASGAATVDGDAGAARLVIGLLGGAAA